MTTASDCIVLTHETDGHFTYITKLAFSDNLWMTPSGVKPWMTPLEWPLAEWVLSMTPMMNLSEWLIEWRLLNDPKWTPHLLFCHTRKRKSLRLLHMRRLIHSLTRDSVSNIKAPLSVRDTNISTLFRVSKKSTYPLSFTNSSLLPTSMCFFEAFWDKICLHVHHNIYQSMKVVLLKKIIFLSG